MALIDYFKKREPMTVIKSVTLPELLLTYSRTAPVFQKWDTETAIEQGMKASAIFYACVDRRAKSVAQVPWKAYRKQRDGSMTEAPDSPLQRLINKPNPDFAWSEMMELMSQHIDLAGNSYWSIIKAGNAAQPVEVWPLLPQGVKIKAGQQRLIDFYRYQYAGVTRDIQSPDMVPRQTYTQDEEGAWVETSSEPGDPQAVTDACNASGLEVTLEQVEAVFGVADVTEQEPFTAMARMGLVMASETQAA